MFSLTGISPFLFRCISKSRAQQRSVVPRTMFGYVVGNRKKMDLF